MLAGKPEQKGLTIFGLIWLNNLTHNQGPTKRKVKAKFDENQLKC